MATETDETYFRKWLDDVSPVVQNHVTETDSQVPGNETNDTTYFRKYLNDPTSV